MIRKRDINDWLLWLMVFRIFVDLYGWKSIGYCLLAAGFLYAVTEIINEKIGGTK